MEFTGIAAGVISLVALISLAVIFILIMYALVFGAPFAPLADNRIETMIKLLRLRKGNKVADIGSGDGRIVIAFARLGIEAHGYEINPLLVAYSRYLIRRENLQKYAFVHLKDFWSQDFSEFNAVTIYGIAHIMARLEKKLVQEMRPGSKIVSNYFKFPNLKKTKEENKVNLYTI